MLLLLPRLLKHYADLGYRFEALTPELLAQKKTAQTPFRQTA